MNRTTPKEPLVAALLSAFITGLGQIYASKVKRGISCFFIYFSLGLIIRYSGPELLLSLIRPSASISGLFFLFLSALAASVLLMGFYIFVMVDACRCTVAYNRNNNLERRITPTKRSLLIIAIVLVALFPHHYIRRLIGKPIAQSSAAWHRNNAVPIIRKMTTVAMSPTLIKGDRLVIDKSTFKTSQVERWDVVAFEKGGKKGTGIRRVVGLPNETVELKGGELLINGVAVERPAGLLKLLYENQAPYGKEGEAQKVPADCYYVLADNSRGGEDSRMWGFVPKKYILGKTVKILFPFDRYGPIK